jgi:hypothetical protein
MKIEKGDRLHIKMTEDKSLRIEPGQDENGCLANSEKDMEMNNIIHKEN